MSYMTRLKGVPDTDDVKPGMAYFAGTGPIGKTCGKCEYYAARKCQMFKRLAGSLGDNIKATFKACKYFEQRSK